MKSPIVYLAAFTVLIFILGVSGQRLNPLLAWNRYDIADFELWRLITGHLMHTNLWHAFINLSVLTASMFLFGNSLRPKTWLIIFLVLCISNSLGLYLFSPWLANYVGLSGVLYGILAVGFLKNIEKMPILNTVILLAITGKIIYEQLPGFDVNYLRTQIEAAVIVDAHLYGFISGICIYTVMLAWEKFKLERQSS